MKSVAVFVALLSIVSAGKLRTTSSVISNAPAAAAPAVTCGGVPTYKNSRPANYADARSTKYDTELKKQVPVVFNAGDVIDFECLPGFSTDGSKDGPNTYQVECAEHGYYKPGGVCLESSKCGPVPNITHAMPTGKPGVAPGSVEFACATGYSLDGEKVVAGGMGKNRFFTLNCQSFGAFEKFTGECKPYAFVPTHEVTRVYTQVFEALFTVSCKGSLKKAFAKGEAAPVDSACASMEDATKGDCEALVGTIQSDFEAKAEARQTWQEDHDKDWNNQTIAGDAPGINEEANTFCTELWKLLQQPASE